MTILSILFRKQAVWEGMVQIQGGTFGKSKEKGNGLTFGLKQKEKKEGEKKTKEKERKFTLTNAIKKSREIRMLSR